MNVNNTEFVGWFRTASPYIRVHRGKTFVIYIEDDMIHGESFTDLVHDIALLNSLGIKVVLVYSARHSIEQRLTERKIALKYHNGMRVTDAEAMDLVKDTAGKLRIEIESRMSMGLGNTPMSNAEVRITSGNYVRAKPLGIIDGIDFMYTGEVRSVDNSTINSRLEAHEVVLVPPLGYSVTGETFNLEAKSLAARVACELHAEKLIYLVDSSGLVDHEGHPVHELTQLEAEGLLQSGTGMEEIIHDCLVQAVDACANSVGRVHVINSAADGALVQELFSRDGVGIMISNSSYDVLRQATIDDIAGILELIVPLERKGVLVERSREKLELEISHFTVMLRDDMIIGCASLYLFPEEAAAEIACLAIHPDYHNSGRGEQLYSALLANAGHARVRKLFALTTHADHWFRERGFEESTLDTLPVQRKNLYNYQRNSKVLIKTM